MSNSRRIHKKRIVIHLQNFVQFAPICQCVFGVNWPLGVHRHYTFDSTKMSSYQADSLALQSHCVKIVTCIFAILFAKKIPNRIIGCTTFFIRFETDRYQKWDFPSLLSGSASVLTYFTSVCSNLVPCNVAWLAVDWSSITCRWCMVVWKVFCVNMWVEREKERKILCLWERGKKCYCGTESGEILRGIERVCEKKIVIWIYVCVCVERKNEERKREFSSEISRDKSESERERKTEIDKQGRERKCMSESFWERQLYVRQCEEWQEWERDTAAEREEKERGQSCEDIGTGDDNLTPLKPVGDRDRERERGRERVSLRRKKEGMRERESGRDMTERKADGAASPATGLAVWKRRVTLDALLVVLRWFRCVDLDLCHPVLMTETRQHETAGG